MTASDAETQAATQAMAAGRAAAAKHESDALVLHEAFGSAVTVEPASSSDDHAVDWLGSGAPGA